MEITEAQFDAANRRGAEKKAEFPAVVSVRYDRRVGRVVISLSSGLGLAFAPKHAQGLENGCSADFADAKITPSGLGVHFPHLDVDIYLPALLEGFLGSKRWLAAAMGKLGGAAARQNGKLGGRAK